MKVLSIREEVKSTKIIECKDKEIILKIIDPMYGTFDFENDLSFSKLLYKLLNNCFALKRLNKIHQAGAVWLWNKNLFNVTRLEHSIGVMLLIRKLKPSDLEQQIAGLLHDISHTAFSHVIDYVVKNTKEDFHEEIVETILKAKNSKFIGNDIELDISIEDVLKEFKMEQVITHLLDESNNKYTILEKDIPNLCADRIDYTLRDQYIYDLYKSYINDKSIIFNIINSFELSSNKQNEFIVFKEKNLGLACEFTQMFKYEVVDFFSNLENLFSNDLFANILRLALQNNFIVMDDIIWGYDEYVLNKVIDNRDKCKEMNEFLMIFDKHNEKLDEIENYVKIVNSDEVYDFITTRKLRFVDFLIERENQTLTHISSLSPKAKQQSEQMGSVSKQQTYLKIIK
ncbi:hypothetical protein ABK040_009363 [Willaertia magna]